MEISSLTQSLRSYTTNNSIQNYKKESANFDQMLNNIKSSGDEKQQLKQAAKAMESLFVKMMYSSMQKTVQKEGLISGGQAEEIFDDMLNEDDLRPTQLRSAFSFIRPRCLSTEVVSKYFTVFWSL
jgi:flagellar protein FlgJ